MSKTITIPLTSDDRVDLINFTQRVEDNKLTMVKLNDLKLTTKEPIVMLPQFRHDIRDLRISYVMRQLPTNHWCRNIKFWIDNVPYGSTIDPISLKDICMVCGFKGKAEDWQVVPERGKQFVYINVAQIIDPNAVSDLIQVPTTREETYGQG